MPDVQPPAKPDATVVPPSAADAAPAKALEPAAAAAPPPPAKAPDAPPPPAPKVEAAPDAQKPAPDAKTEAHKATATAVEIEIKLPAGAQFDPKAIDAFKALAKEHSLTSKQAQAIVDAEALRVTAMQKQHTEHVQTLRRQDIEALKADKDFGGARFDKSVADARASAKYWGGEELSKLLEAAGLDAHPAVVKTFARIKAGMSEDQTKPPGQEPAVAQRAPAMSQTKKIARRYEQQK